MIQNLLNYMSSQPAQTTSAEDTKPQKGIKLTIEIEKRSSSGTKVPQIAQKLQMSLGKDGKTYTIEQIEKKLKQSEAIRTEKMNTQLTKVKAHNSRVSQTKNIKLQRIQERRERFQMKLIRSEQKKQDEMKDKIARLKAHNSQIQPSVEFAKLREEQRLNQKNEEIQAKLIKSNMKREENLNQMLSKLSTHNSSITKGLKEAVKAQEDEKMKEKIMELSQKLDKKIDASRQKKMEILNEKLAKLNQHNSQITKGFKDNLKVEGDKKLEQKLKEQKEQLEKRILATRQKKEEFINEKLSKLSSHNAQITKGFKDNLEVKKEQSLENKKVMIEKKIEISRQKKEELINQKLNKLSSHNAQITKGFKDQLKAEEDKKLEEKLKEQKEQLEKRIEISRKKKEELQKQRVERGRNEVLKVLKVKERMSSEEKANQEQACTKIDQKLTKGEQLRKENIDKIVESTKAHNEKVDTTQQTIEQKMKDEIESRRGQLMSKLERAEQNRRMNLDRIKFIAAASARGTNTSPECKIQSPNKSAAPKLKACH